MNNYLQCEMSPITREPKRCAERSGHNLGKIEGGCRTWSILKIYLALLARGTKAAGFGYGLLFNSHRSCYQLSATCCQAVHRCQNGGDLTPPLARLRIRYTTVSPWFFKAVSSAAKTSKTCPKAFKKRQEYMPKSICEEFVFCITFNVKTCPKLPNVDQETNTRI